MKYAAFSKLEDMEANQEENKPCPEFHHSEKPVAPVSEPSSFLWESLDAGAGLSSDVSGSKKLHLTCRCRDPLSWVPGVSFKSRWEHL